MQPRLQSSQAGHSRCHYEAEVRRAKGDSEVATHRSGGLPGGGGAGSLECRMAREGRVEP